MSTSSVSSGGMIDVNSIVNSLMQIEQRPLQSIQTKISSANVSISAMGEVKSLAETVFSAADSMQNSMMLTGRSVVALDTTVAKASISNASLASVGSISVQTSRLASVQRHTFGGFSSIDTAMGPTAPSSLVISIPSGSSLLATGESAISNVEIETAGKTLAEVRDEINDSALHPEFSGKIRASLISTGDGDNPWILQIASVKTGSNASFTATWPTTDADDALVTPSGPRLNDPTDGYVAPSDANALAIINGVTVQSQTNVFDHAVSGVKLEMLKAASSTSIQVSDNRSVIIDKVKSFVSSFSTLLTKLRDVSKPGSAEAKAGPLAGNSGILGLSTNLFMAYTQGITLSGGRSWNDSTGSPALDASGNARPLPWSQLGVSVTRGGAVVLDEAVLNAAVSGELGDALIQGFSSQIRTALEAFRGSGGSLQGTIDSMRGNVTRLNTDLTNTKERLTRLRASLVSKYAALDARLAQMGQISSSLQSSLASLQA